MTPFDECLHFSGLSFVHTVKDRLPPPFCSPWACKEMGGWGVVGWRSHYVSVFVSWLCALLLVCPEVRVLVFRCPSPITGPDTSSRFAGHNDPFPPIGWWRWKKNAWLSVSRATSTYPLDLFHVSFLVERQWKALPKRGKCWRSLSDLCLSHIPADKSGFFFKLRNLAFRSTFGATYWYSERFSNSNESATCSSHANFSRSRQCSQHSCFFSSSVYFFFFRIALISFYLITTHNSNRF